MTGLQLFDPLASPFDTDSSIGCDRCGPSVGASFSFAKAGSVLELARAKGAKQGGGDVAKATKQVRSAADDFAEGVRSVTRNPITHAVLLGVAAVPVVGPVAAGVGEAALAFAEGVAGAVQEVSKIADDIGQGLENAWCGIFDCGKPSAAEVAAAKKKLEAARKKARAKEKEVAALLKKAQAGDKAATEKMNALLVVMNPSLLVANRVAELKNKGMPISTIVAPKTSVLSMTQEWQKFAKAAESKAKAGKADKSKGPAQSAAVRKGFIAAVNKSAEQVRAKVEAAAVSTPPGVSGVLVTLGGATKSGRFVQAAGAAPCWVVKPDATIVFGKFKV